MRSATLTLAAIVLLAAGIRLAYVFTTGHSADIATQAGEVAHNILVDERWFVRNEHAGLLISEAEGRRGQILDPASIDYAGLDSSGGWVPEVSRAPGVAAFIAAVWAITGDQRYVQPQALQGLIDALMTLLVYWIAMQLFGRRRVATLAALAYALYPPIAWQAVTLYDDVWGVDFTIAIVALYLLSMRSCHRWRWLAILGVVTGVGAYFRPQVLLIVPALALVTAGRSNLREALRKATTVTAVAIAIVAPWTVRNYEDYHTLLLVRSGVWETMLSGLNELPNDFAETIELRAQRARPDLVPETPQWDAYLKHYFLAAAEQHPLFVLEALIHRIGLATVLAPASHAGTEWMRRGAGDVLHRRGGLLAFIVERPFEALEYALEPLVFLLAMAGLALTWRRWRAQNTILLAVVVAVVVPYVLMHVEARYLLPAAFVYIIWISLAVDLAVERIKRRWSRSALAMRGPRSFAVERIK
jgi:4-amino-4-deoxy-L-arabinose transferase-like glycosyltransferase